MVAIGGRVAITAREVIMIFRGQNYLSGAIRRVGRDVAQLSRPQQLAAQRASLINATAQARQVRQRALDERASLMWGSRRLALDDRRAKLSDREISHVNRIRQIESSITTNQEQQLRNLTRREQLTAALSGAAPARGVARGLTQDQMIRAQRLEVMEGRRLREVMITLNRQREAQAEIIGRSSARVQKLAADETDAANRMRYLTQQIKNTDQRLLNNLLPSLRMTDAAIRAYPWERFQTGARYVEHAGRVLQMFGLIAGAVFGFAAEQASKFATQITLAATQTTVAGNNTARAVMQNAAVLQRAVQQMLTEGLTPARPEELNQALYTIFSGITLEGTQNQQLQQGIQILKELNKVFVANYGQVQFNDVVKAGIALINNFNLTADQLPQVLNRMQASVRFGAMSMGDFVGSLNQVVPAFRGAHFGFDQMATDIAFVSRLFPSLRFGTTGLARLTEILSRRETIQGIRKQLGIDIAPRGMLLPINQIVDEIIKARPELAKGGTDLTNFFKTVANQQGTIQARRVFVGFATQGRLYHTIARQIIGDNNELNKSFTDMSQAPQVRWEEFKRELQGLILTIGAGAIPAFRAIGQPIAQAVHWFNSLSPATQRLVGYIGTFIAVGTLLVGTLAAIGGGVASIVAGFMLWRMSRQISQLVEFAGAAKGAEAAVAGLGTEAGLISAGVALRFGLGLGALVAIPILIHYRGHIDEIVNALGGLQTMLAVVSAVMFARMVPALAATLAGMTATIAGAEGLTVALAALGAAPVAAIAIPVVLQIESKNIESKIEGLENRLPGWLRTALTADPGGIARKTQEFLGLPLGVPDPAVKRATESQKAATGAIQQSIAESPRYQHAIRANQAQVDAFSAALERQAAEQRRVNAINKEVGVAPGRRGIQQWITLVQEARKRMLGQPKDLQAALAYERLITQLNARFKNQPALLAAINDVLGAYNQNLKTAADNTKNLSVTSEQVLTGLKQMYDNFLQQEQGIFGTLFQGPFVQSPAMQNVLQWGGTLTGRDLVKDYQSQINQFTRFHRVLDNLRRRGAPPELIKQLTALGPSALKEIQALARLAPRELQNYFRMFQRGQAIIHRQAMADLRQQLRDYRRFGRNIALAIVAGLKDENSSITRQLLRMLRQIFPNLPQAGHGPQPGRHPSGHTTIHHNPTYHVTAPKGEPASIKTQVRHAEFARRNRYTGRGPGPR